MKAILLQITFCLTFLLPIICFGQTETFEDDTKDTYTFTTDGFVFNTTGDMFVEFYLGLGCGSDQWLGSGFGDGGSTGPSFGSFEVDEVGQRFVLSTSTPFCAWTSNDDGNNFAAGNVEFVGSLLAGGTISETFYIDPPDNFTFDMITFSNAIWGGQELTALAFNFTTGLNYLAIDNIVFDAIEVCDLAVTCPSDPAAIEGCSSADVSPTSALAFSTSPVTINETQFNSEGGSVTTSSNITSISYQDVATGVGVHPIIVTRTFTVTDDCVSTETCSQTFTIQDTQSPTIPTCPPMKTVEGCNTGDITNGSQTNLPYSTSLTLITLNQFSTEGGVLADNCTPHRSIAYQDAANGTCPRVVTRTFTVEDFGFNTVQCQQTINIEDTIDPVISDCPSNIGPLPMDNGVCGAAANWPAPTATDNCGGIPLILQIAGDPSGSTFPEGTHTVQYTATDACMNVSLCTFTIQVLADTQAPTANCPGNIIVDNDAGQCGANIPFSIPNPTDNCPGASSSANPASGSFFAVGTTPVQVTATDASGNTSNCSFNITVNDTEKPTVNCPPNITVGNDVGQCNAVVSYISSASDNCPGVSVSCIPITGSTFDVGTTKVRCTATDAVGNTDTCSFNVIVNDTEKPTVNCPPNVTVGNDAGQCGANVTVTASVSDNCNVDTETFSATVNPTYGSSYVFNGSGTDASGFYPIGTHSVTFTASDDAVNPNTCIVEVIVNDGEKPVITDCPGNQTLSNVPGDCYNTASWSNPTASDNCNLVSFIRTSSDPSVNINVIAGSSFAAFPVGTTTITYTASDDFGSSICSFNVTVNDTENPTPNCPANINTNVDMGQCNAKVTFSASAIDNCPGVILSYNPDSGTSFPIGTNTVTCTATDAAGNPGQCTFEITVNDNEKPIPNCNNISVALDNAPDTHTFTTAEINAMGAGSMDNCSSVTLAVNPASVDCDDAPSKDITITVMDVAGNFESCTALVTITDPSNFCCQFTATCPTITDLGIFDCNTLGSLSALPTNQAEAEAAPYNIVFGANPCGTIHVDASDDIAPNVCGGTVQTITRTVFTWDDLPGGTPGVFDPGVEDSHTCTYTYNVNPDGAPTAVCPAIADVELDTDGNGTLPANIGTGLSTDDCGSPTETSPLQTYTCADIGPQTVVLTATDACNNQHSATCSFFVVDKIVPAITCPADVTRQCDQSTTSLWTGTATATDNCTASPVITESDASTQGNSGCPYYQYTITRTWTADDGNGNTASCDQIITVEDTNGPAITCPANVTVECDADHSPTNTGSATAVDNCDTQPSISSSDATTAGGCPNAWTITRTWTATDACGNSTPCDQTITVEDSTAPAITCPADVTVECSGDHSPAANGTATATDNCSAVGDITIGESDATTPGSCAKEWTVTRTWTATDECGKSSTCDQTINVVDTQGPTITCPADVTVVCDADNSSNATGVATATDNCSAAGDITIGEADANTAGACPQEWTITRTWTATDECGQSSTCDQTITVEDTTGPVMACGTLTVTPNADGTYALSQTEIDGLGTGTTDNCGAVTFSASPNTFDCADEGANTVTVTGTDECGNQNSCSATVTVEAYLTIVSCTATDETCAGAGDGTISISATALGGQVKYSIDGGTNFSASGNFTNLTPGTYNIVVKVFGIAEICEKTDTKTVAAGGSAQVWYKDADGDGYSDGNTLTGCTQPTGYIASPLTGTDCNDSDPAINPGATETCDGLDNDCDGIIPADETDADGDGYMVCEGDCDDTDAAVNPGATEICNGIDDDCDGDIDEGVSSGQTYTGNVTFASQADVDAWQACYSIIDGNLTISGYNISSLANLAGLTEVTGSMSIFYNGILTSLDGLENIATVGGSLSMFYNFSLADCCAIHTLINGGVTGAISIFFNAAGCNSVAEINSNCGNPLLSAPTNEVSNAEQLTPEKASDEKVMQMTVFPNPAKSGVSILIKRTSSTARLQILDVLGRRVFYQQLGEGVDKVEINLANQNFSSGIYRIVVLEGDNQYTEQFVIQ